MPESGYALNQFATGHININQSEQPDSSLAVVPHPERVIRPVDQHLGKRGFGGERHIDEYYCINDRKESKKAKVHQHSQLQLDSNSDSDGSFGGAQQDEESMGSEGGKEVENYNSSNGNNDMQPSAVPEAIEVIFIDELGDATIKHWARLIFNFMSRSSRTTFKRKDIENGVEGRNISIRAVLARAGFIKRSIRHGVATIFALDEIKIDYSVMGYNKCATKYKGTIDGNGMGSSSAMKTNRGSDNSSGERDESTPQPALEMN